jgi:thiol-disulfide isomerase/thioredoxin
VTNPDEMNREFEYKRRHTMAPPNQGSNAFAITVLVIAVLAIIVCIMVVFMVKPCPNDRNGVVEVILEPDESSGAAVKSDSPIQRPQTTEALQKIISQGDTVVMFFTTWCGHCKAAKPQFEAAATAIRTRQPDLKFVLMDGDLIKSDLAKWEISGYPTIRIYRNGKKLTDYDGARTKDAMMTFASKLTKSAGAAVSPSRELTIENIDLPVGIDLTIDTPTLVMFYTKWCHYCNQTKPEFVKAANALMPKTKVLMVDTDVHPSVKSVYSLKGYPTILMLQTATDYKQFSAARNADELVKFARS